MLWITLKDIEISDSFKERKFCLFFMKRTFVSYKFKNVKFLAGSKFVNCSFIRCEFIDCVFEEQDLFYMCSFYICDFSGSKGIPTQQEILEENFEKTDEGFIVYKVFNVFFDKPKHWEITRGSIITENVDYNRHAECSYGISVATKEWLAKNTSNITTWWECLIKNEWLPDVVIPFDFKGKMRCAKLMLIRPFERTLEGCVEFANNTKIYTIPVSAASKIKGQT